ncbi:hypothetical protein V2J09_007186 [Rumex salicifolius]
MIRYAKGREKPLQISTASVQRKYAFVNGKREQYSGVLKILSKTLFVCQTLAMDLWTKSELF